MSFWRRSGLLRIVRNSILLHWFFREIALSVLVVGSVSYVLGTVVGAQFHDMILNLKDHDWLFEAYLGTVFRANAIGVILAFLVPPLVSSLLKQRISLELIYGLYVLLCWTSWTIPVGCSFADEIANRSDILLMFYWSSFSLSVVAAISGVALLHQLRDLFDWGRLRNYGDFKSVKLRTRIDI